MQDRVDALAPTMSREAYGSGGVNQRSPNPARRDRDIRDPSASSSAKYYGPSSISQPVSSRGSPIGSRTTSTDHSGRRSSRYGVSRSSNASPLTLPAEGPVPHSISTSAFNVGPSASSRSGGQYYNEDLGSPTMDSRGHHRSRSATRVPLRNYHSLERDQDREFVPIRDPRDRSLDRTDMSGHASRHPRSRERSLDRSGYRDRDDYAYRDIDGPIDGDPYRSTSHARTSHGSYGDSRHSYGRSGGDSYVMELQTRLNDLQCQYSNLKRELDATTQKLGSSMHSIKTFWSPELKKERALRKEEAAKYALLNDQMKSLRADNSKQAAVIRQLEEELRLNHMRNPDAEVQQHLEALYNEKEHMTKEIFLLRETIKELELRIETQKQTLTARDESIKKLMEIKGVGGKIMEEDRIEFEMLKTKLKETESRYRHLENMMQSRDKDLTKNEKNRIQILEATLETKESRINILEKEIDLLESKLLEVNFDVKIMNGNDTAEDTAKYENHENVVKELTVKMDELRIELNRRDQEIMAMSAKMKTLEEQHHDYQRHIAVLKESLCAKEEHYNMLQADVEELRIRLEEKNKLIEKKTQQTMNSSQERNRLTQEVQELRDHMEIKDRKINVLQRKIENLEDLLKEKDNQVDMARARLTAMQAHHSSSEGALSSLEEAIGDKDKQISQLRDQRDRAEQEKNEERELHEREIAEYKMKMHGMESEMEKLQSDIQRLQQQRRPSIQDASQARRPSMQDASQTRRSSMQDASQAEVISLRKQIDEKQKKNEEMDKILKKCQEKLKILESQPPPKAGADSENQKRLIALENLCGELTKEKEKLGKDIINHKEDAKRLQTELDRLLDVMTVTEKEKFSLNEQIRELQEALKESNSKLQGAKRGQQADRTKNAQMLEEARRRESEAAKEAAKAQEQVQQQQERIEELEEALRESVRITAKREIAVAEKQSLVDAADEKIKRLQSEVRGLQNAYNARCTNCPPMKVRLKNVEKKLQNLISERKLHLEQLFEMKQEALSAAISEKDSHLAFLEMSGIKNAKTAEQVDKLKTEKKQLVDKIKLENENRVKLLTDVEDSNSNQSSSSSDDNKDSTEDSENDGLQSVS